MKRLKMILNHEEVPLLEEELYLYDISGLETHSSEDPIYQEMDWHEDEKLVPEHEEEAYILVYAPKEVLDQIVKDFPDKKTEYEEIEEINWNKKWEESFTGIKVDDIFVRPPWVEPDDEALDIIIEPGMAFGTGTHETTMGMLKAMKKYMPEGARVLDMGTGSGVLAITSMKLGASSAVGIEIDELAIKNARHNGELNEVDVDFQLASNTKGMNLDVNFILANILPEVLKPLKEEFDALLKPEDLLLLSGIIHRRVDEMLRHYEGYTHVETYEEGEWSTLVLQKN